MSRDEESLSSICLSPAGGHSHVYGEGNLKLTTLCSWEGGEKNGMQADVQVLVEAPNRRRRRRRRRRRLRMVKANGEKSYSVFLKHLQGLWGGIKSQEGEFSARRWLWCWTRSAEICQALCLHARCSFFLCIYLFEM
ncbi:hypothetical protein AOLI_G00020460 [Acnodon oligacanthus]